MMFPGLAVEDSAKLTNSEEVAPVRNRHTIVPAVLLVLSLVACSSGPNDTDSPADALDISESVEPADAVADRVEEVAVTDGARGVDQPVINDVAVDATLADGENDWGAPETADTPTIDPGPAGPCLLAEKAGRFEIADFDIFAAVMGTVNSGVIPLTVLEEVGKAGDCRLMNKTIPLCNPPCTPGDLCTGDGSCIPFPFPQDVGTVTVTGLVQPVEIEVGPGNDYYDTTLPSPPWEPGSHVVLSAAGGAYSAFELEVDAVEPITGVNEKWSIDPGEPLEISWTPSEGPGRIYIYVNVDQHGVSPVTLFCDTEDTGSLTVDATLIAQFLSFGVSGFAVGELRRRSVDSVTIEPGCVELSIFDGFVPLPVVGGHTPCNSTADCPEGQKCNVMINTCIDE